MKRFTKSLLVTALVPVMAFSANADSLKVGFIAQEDSAKAMKRGDYISGAATLERNMRTYSNTEKLVAYINLCAAYTKLSQLTLAEQACMKSTDMLPTVKAFAVDLEKLKALAFNNLGVYHHLVNEPKQALSMFNTSLSIDKRSLAALNLTHVTSTDSTTKTDVNKDAFIAE